MAQQSIGQGPGNLVPDTETKMFLCAGTIAKGDVVTMSGTTGYSIIVGTNVLPPVGVASIEGGASGDWIQVVTSGFCDYLTCTATNIVDKDLLYVDASGDAAGVTVGDDLGVQVGAIFGQALQAEESTTITKALIFKLV